MSAYELSCTLLEVVLIDIYFWENEYRDTGIQEYRDTGIQGYSDTGIQGYRDTGIQEYRNTQRNKNKIFNINY